MKISYAKLGEILKKAYRAQNDRYAEVSITFYAGGPFQVKVSCSGLDEGNMCSFYTTFVSDDPDFGFDMGFGVGSFKDAVFEYFSDQGYTSEVDKNEVEIEESEIKRLEELGEEQKTMFENKEQKEALFESVINAGAKKLNESADRSYEIYNGWTNDIEELNSLGVSPAEIRQLFEDAFHNVIDEE